MATNTEVRQRSIKRVNKTSVSVDASGQAVIDIPELRHIDTIEDVTVQPFGDGGTAANEGRVGRVQSVGSAADGTPQATCQFYIGGGAGAALDNDLDSTVIDNVLITASGL